MLKYIILICLAILSIIITTLVCMQKPAETGLGAGLSNSGSSRSNAFQSADTRLKRNTAIFGIVLAIFVIAALLII